MKQALASMSNTLEMPKNISMFESTSYSDMRSKVGIDGSFSANIHEF